MPISTNAPFNEFGNSMMQRDIEQLYLLIQPTGDGAAGEAQTQDVSQSETQNPDVGTGGGSGVGVSAIPVPIAEGGTAATTAADARTNLGITLPVPRSDLANGAATSVIGRAANSTGAVADIAAAADDRVLMRASATLSFAQVTRAALVSGVGTSVIGRSANTTGVVADIAAGADDTVLGRRSGALTFAKIATAEITDANVTKAKIENSGACSVVGRSANSSGVVADISAAADGTVLQRLSSALSFVRDMILGTTSNAGSITIANATSATAIVISPTLVTAAGKVMSVREIDVCDSGVAKKMLVIASVPY